MKKLLYIFDNIEIWTATFFFCLMTFLVILQLISRFSGVTIIFTEEFARYSYIWIAFLAMALHEKKRGHFNVTFFTMFLKGRGEAALEFFTDLLCSVIFLYLFYWSILYWKFSSVILTIALRLPMTFVTTCLCIGFFMCFVRRFSHTIGHAKQLVKGGK